MPAGNIHPISDQLIDRTTKEKNLGFRAGVFWFCGLSGSGKSTIASSLELSLNARGIHSVVLDGDNLRAGVNQGLGFSDEDRMENIRRTAEIAKLLVQNGLVVIVSLITPLARHRENAAKIIGPPDYHEIFVKASFNTCKTRDVKGLYAKAEKDEIESFTGKKSDFEEPENTALILDTDKEDINESLDRLYSFVNRMIQIK